MLQCNRFDDDLATRPAAWKAGNRVTFSSLTYCAIEQYNAATYSIKYVLQGTENYFLHGQKFSVSAGNFLLVNGGQPIDFFIRSRKQVSGFCIHLEESLLQEMYGQLAVNESRLLDYPFEKHPIPPFEEIMYSDKENNLGAYLLQMARSFDSSTDTIVAEPAALYYHLSQHLLQVQNSFPTGGRQLGVVRNSTRQELIRRLELAKEVMEAQEAETLNMDVVAQQCALSGSHLFRSFKKLYGVSPYQYLLQRKIERAHILLQTKGMAVTEVALHCGFADLPTFSKAFKKRYGVSPSYI